MTRILRYQFPDSHKLNHRIIAAFFVKKGSKPIRNDRLFLCLYFFKFLSKKPL